MSATSKPTPEKIDVESVNKSRMLVALLGADFTKQTSHPFFRRLSETATQEPDTPAAPAAVSQSLKKLLAALESTEPPKPKEAPPEPRSEPQPAPENASSPPPKARRRLPSPDEHPAVIAKELRDFPRREQSEMIRTLPGPVARQVSLFLWELSKSTEGQ